MLLIQKFFELLHTSNNLLAWQVIELTFFAPWLATKNTNQSTFLLLVFLISIFLATQEHVRDTCGVQGFVNFTIIYHLSLFFKIIIF